MQLLQELPADALPCGRWVVDIVPANAVFSCRRCFLRLGQTADPRHMLANTEEQAACLH